MSEIKLPESLEIIFKDMSACGYESRYTLKDLRRAIAVALLRARGLTWEAAGDLRLAGMANAEAEALEREGA